MMAHAGFYVIGYSGATMTNPTIPAAYGARLKSLSSWVGIALPGVVYRGAWRRYRGRDICGAAALVLGDKTRP